MVETNDNRTEEERLSDAARELAASLGERFPLHHIQVRTAPSSKMMFEEFVIRGEENPLVGKPLAPPEKQLLGPLRVMVTEQDADGVYIQTVLDRIMPLHKPSAGIHPGTHHAKDVAAVLREVADWLDPD